MEREGGGDIIDDHGSKQVEICKRWIYKLKVEFQHGLGVGQYRRKFMLIYYVKFIPGVPV